MLTIAIASGAKSFHAVADGHPEIPGAGPSCSSHTSSPGIQLCTTNGPGHSIALVSAVTLALLAAAKAHEGPSNDSLPVTPANATAPRQLASMAFDQCANREENTDYWGDLTQGSSYTGCNYFSSIRSKRGSGLPSGRLEKETPTCPTQQLGTELDGPDIRVATTWTNWQCCEECNKTPGCAAYSWTLSSSECRLKYTAGGSKLKPGVTSAKVIEPKSKKCPTQQKNTVFGGSEIRKVSGVSSWQCCEECGKTAGCAAYSWTSATSECSLKWFAGSATAKDGVVSAELKDVAANDKCPTQQKNTVFGGSEIRKVSGVSSWQCCEECGKTAGLKWFAGSATAKDGVVSAELKDVLKPETCGKQENDIDYWGNDIRAVFGVTCPVQEQDIDYYGNDLKCLHGVTNAQCCEACSKTKGCRAYTYVKGYDVFGLWWSPSACYLKTSAVGRRTKKGLISGKVVGG
ncbi:hypothetical protein ATCC90586_009245 [Pythium insidiosum]|nr:hypothetical protein ATCC90586_009245 [Pythium insidiosum]